MSKTRREDTGGMDYLPLDPSKPSCAGSNPTTDLDDLAGRPPQTFAIPESQFYYWTAEWQADERESMLELERGEGIRFSSGHEAAAWLLADDDEHDDGQPPDLAR
jgi:hypothetical protein